MGDLALVLLPMAVFGLLALLSLRFGAESRPGFDGRPVRDDRPNWPPIARAGARAAAPAPPAPPRGGEPVPARPHPRPRRGPRRRPAPPAPSARRPSRRDGCDHPRVRTPDEALEALRAHPCGARVAGTFGPEDGVSLVGGAVRDLLLGRAPRELDLVVEGDLAAALAARSAGRGRRSHDRFGTATLRTPDGCTYDLVRARAETYPHPGALPEVRPGDARGGPRAAATSRSTPWRCAPAASSPASPARARTSATASCASCTTRSFADDPTRLWRVARYARAAGLRGRPAHPRARRRRDPGTAGGDRLGAELRLALREPDPFAALDAAAALQPGLLPPGYAVREDAGRAALALLPPEGRPDLVVLASGAGGVDAATLLAWLDDLGFPAADRDLVGAAVPGRDRRAAARGAHGVSDRAGGPRRAVEAVALAGGENARRWLQELRHVPPGHHGRRPARRGRPARARGRRAPAPRPGRQARRPGAGPRRRAARRARRPGGHGRLAWPRCPSSPTRSSPRPSAGPTATSPSTSTTATSASRRAAAGCPAAPTRR